MAGRRKKTEEGLDLAATDAAAPPPVALPEPERPDPTAAELPEFVSTKPDSADTPAAPEMSEHAPGAPFEGIRTDDTRTDDTRAPDGAPGVAPAPEPAPPVMADDPVRTDPAPESAPLAPVILPAPRSNPLLPVLGGVMAAFLGFVLAQAVPQGWPLEATTRQFAEVEARIAALDRKLTQAAPAPVDPALADRLTALEQRLDALPATTGADPAALDELRAEIAALQQSATPPTDLAPLQAELEALRAELAAIPRESGVAQELDAMKAAAEAERAASAARADALRAESDTLKAQADATARAAVARGAILRVQAALEAGGAFDAALADLGAAGVAVPPELATHADGLPLLAQLQAGFPDAARAALAATTKPAEGAGLSDRLGAFLKGQSGLRSTAPRDGDHPDAVLSRAEASLRGGDLPATLAELDKLPPEAAPALAEWRAQADIRAAAAASLAALAANLDAK